MRRGGREKERYFMPDLSKNVIITIYWSIYIRDIVAFKVVRLFCLVPSIYACFVCFFMQWLCFLILLYKPFPFSSWAGSITIAVAAAATADTAITAMHHVQRSRCGKRNTRRRGDGRGGRRGERAVQVCMRMGVLLMRL